MNQEMKSIQEQLAAPFDEVKFRVMARSKDKTKGLAAAYIDARHVMNRLDEVVGLDGWSTEYRLLDPTTKAVECKLTLYLMGSAISKADTGYPNSDADASDGDKEPLKAAYSDALKRAAVQVGIGRYLYSLQLEQDWLPINEYGAFLQMPRIKGSAPSQRPHEAPPSTPDTAKFFDTARLQALMAEKGVSGEDLARVTGKSTNGRALPAPWLKEHPDLTIEDLVDTALKVALDTKANAEALKV